MPTLDKVFTAVLYKSPAKAGWTYLVTDWSAEYFGTRGLVKVRNRGRTPVPKLVHGSRRRHPQTADQGRSPHTHRQARRPNSHRAPPNASTLNRAHRR